MTLSVYDRALAAGASTRSRNGELGAVSILGDLAALVPMPTDADQAITKYIQQGYRASDRIYVGVDTELVIPPGDVLTFRAPVSEPFKPEGLCIPSWVSPYVRIEEIKIGSVTLLDGRGAVNADTFTEQSNLGNRLSFPTVETSQEIIMRIRNVSALPQTPVPTFYGVRLRK